MHKSIKIVCTSLAVVAHALNPTLRKQKQKEFCEFASSRSTERVQGQPGLLEKQKEKKGKKKENKLCVLFGKLHLYL